MQPRGRSSPSSPPCSYPGGSRVASVARASSPCLGEKEDAGHQNMAGDPSSLFPLRLPASPPATQDRSALLKLASADSSPEEVNVGASACWRISFVREQKRFAGRSWTPARRRRGARSHLGIGLCQRVFRPARTGAAPENRYAGHAELRRAWLRALRYAKAHRLAMPPASRDILPGCSRLEKPPHSGTVRTAWPTRKGRPAESSGAIWRSFRSAC